MTRRRGEGQIVVVFALSLFALIAMAGLLIDGGRAWQDRRQAQLAADMSALSAALEYAKGGTDTAAQLEARSLAASNGFGVATGCNGASLTNGTDGVNGVQVTKPAADQVKVRVTRPLRTTFAAAVGQGCWMVSADATARYSAASVAGPTVFAASRDCPEADTLKWNGSEITVTGNVISNGGLDINDDDAISIDGSVTWYDNPPGCDNVMSNDSTVPTIATTTYSDFPINYTYADFPCTFNLSIAEVDKAGGPYWLNEAAHTLKPGVYCRHDDVISVKGQYTNGNVTFVSESVNMSPADLNFTPYYNGVFIFADGDGSGTINVSGANASWAGLIFAPNGDIHLVGADLGVTHGNVWGQTIDLGGNRWTIQGSAFGAISPLQITLIE